MIQAENLFQEEYAKSCVSQRVSAPSAYFVNIADLHYGLNHRKYFLQWLEFLMSIPNLYFGLGGDAGNGVTRGSKGNPLEEWASGSQQLYALAEDLKPIVKENRLLYIIKGNHWAGRLQDETFTIPEELLAWLLGKPELYKGSQAITYFNVNKNCYVNFTQHKSPKSTKKASTFHWVNADISWREHYHENSWESKVVMEHNKYTKKPIIKEVYEINSGHWQVLPTYCADIGMRPVLPGCWIAEMSGEKRNINIWSNNQLYEMVKRGYKL